MKNSVRRRLTRQISKKGLPAMYATLDRRKYSSEFIVRAAEPAFHPSHLKDVKKPWEVLAGIHPASMKAGPFSTATEYVARRFQSPNS